MRIRFSSYSQTFNSFGVIVSRDRVLQQWEPYEVTRHYEPHVIFYFGKRQFKFWMEFGHGTWLYRYWERQRDRENRETTDDEVEF